MMVETGDPAFFRERVTAPEETAEFTMVVSDDAVVCTPVLTIGSFRLFFFARFRLSLSLHSLEGEIDEDAGS